MDLRDELQALGVDVEEALSLLNGNTSLYERLLGNFVELLEELDVQPDFDGSDYAETLEKVHKLKGVAGNLALTPLYQGYSKVVSLLREDKPEEARKVFKDILPTQAQIVHCIERHK